MKLGFRLPTLSKRIEAHTSIIASFLNDKLELLINTDFKVQLIYHFYKFSGMYLESVSQQSLLVNTLYPEMIAEMYPHIENEHLSDFGKNNLWFL